jgi:hypothetical protein
MPIADGVWTATGPVSILGMPFTSTMTVLRLGGGGLLLHSPLAPTPERWAAVEALGTVGHLYAPNAFHHLHIGAWAERCPGARLHAPAGLAKKRPDLRIDRVHGSAPEPGFAGVVDEVPIDGFRLEESVLCFRPARTLLVADLVHNVGRPEDRRARLYTRAMGFCDRVALSRMLRFTAVADRAAMRRSLDRVLALAFDRVVVGHGAPIERDARAALAHAFAWLPAPT